MKKKRKYLFFILIAVIGLLIDAKQVYAAIRYDFNVALAPVTGEYTKINHPIGDDGITPTKFKYIRVRLETGSGYGDKIDVYAIVSNTYIGYTLGAKKGLAFSGARTYVIDFKAPNAPTRLDADITVDCSNVTQSGITYSNDDYCIANENYTYGIKFENKSVFGGKAIVKGGFSFEN